VCAGALLDVGGERLGATGAFALDQVRRVDQDLAFEAADAPERVVDRPGRNRQQDGVRARDVPAVLADPLDLVPGLLPEIGEPASDVAPADRRDLSCRLLS